MAINPGASSGPLAGGLFAGQATTGAITLGPVKR